MVMETSIQRFVPMEGAEVVALDGESLGQLVRRHTLDKENERRHCRSWIFYGGEEAGGGGRMVNCEW
jgi:hypothetical protein